MFPLTLILLTIQALFLPYMLWLLVMVIVGQCRDKKFPEPTKRLQIAVLICARNEELVVGKLIDSLKAQDYPADSFEVFLIAHNCTDNTASIGREHGATVWELTQTDHPSKGTALTYAVDRIRTEFPDRFDAYCIFDADNIADSGFLTEVNAGLQSGEAQGVVGFRDSVNPDVSWVSNMCAAHWTVVSRIYSMPRRRVGLSCFVQGTGFAFLKECIEPEGWTAHSITEDFEFTANTILKGKKITHTLRAKFYDEQPTELNAWLGQLYRWMFGAKVNTHYALKALGSILSHPIQKLDLFWNATAILMSGLSTLASAIVLTCATIMNIPIIPGTPVFVNLLIGAGATIASYLGIMLITLVCVINSGKSVRQYWRGILVYPMFIFTASFLLLLTLFHKKCQWKPLIHRGK